MRLSMEQRGDGRLDEHRAVGQAGTDLEMRSAGAVEVVVGVGIVVSEAAWGRLGCGDRVHGTWRLVCGLGEEVIVEVERVGGDG